MKTNIGIWLDREQAVVVSLKNGNQEIQIVESNVEPYHVKGGARSKTPYGPQDAVSEQKMLNRRKKQLSHYFDDIKKAVQGAAKLYVFGPGDTKIGLEKSIRDDHLFRGISLTVETADNMTQNQKAAQVRDFFATEK
jgi:hypothetical protein